MSLLSRQGRILPESVRRLMGIGSAKPRTDDQPSGGGARQKGPLLFFDYGGRYYGGSYRSTVNLLRTLTKMTDVAVSHPYEIPGEYVDDVRRLGVPIHVVEPRKGHRDIGGHSRVGRLLRLMWALPSTALFVRRLRRLLESIGPRAVWTTSEKALYVLTKASRGRFPLAIFIRREIPGTLSYCRDAWRRCALVLGVSQAALDSLSAGGFRPARARVIHTGIDIGELNQRASSAEPELPGADRPLKLAMPATLLPLKNHILAIRGVGKFLSAGGQAVLWICGGAPATISAPYQAELEAAIGRLNLHESVHLLGYRPDAPAIMARADVVTLTSTTEGLPRVVLEGMALGKPVLATNVGGVPEAVRDGIDGFLVRPDDVRGYVECLDKLRDPDLRRRMGRAGQERILREFSPAREAGDFLEAMNEIAL